MWCGCVCRTGREVFTVKTRIDEVDRGKIVCDGTKVLIKMRGLHVVGC